MSLTTVYAGKHTHYRDVLDGPLESPGVTLVYQLRPRKKKQLWPYATAIIRRGTGLVFGQKLSRKLWWSE